MRDFIICDLDGTLYNHTYNGRIELAFKGEYDEYHAQSINDLPHPEIVYLVQVLSQKHIVVAITGRNEKFRNITSDWLFQHDVPIESLWMRPDADFRKDAILKQDLLEQALEFHERTRDDILFSLDDRDQSVQGWREAGIPCLQVRPDGA